MEQAEILPSIGSSASGVLPKTGRAADVVGDEELQRWTV
jgi:hypothetical protein